MRQYRINSLVEQNRDLKEQSVCVLFMYDKKSVDLYVEDKSIKLTEEIMNICVIQRLNK